MHLFSWTEVISALPAWVNHTKKKRKKKKKWNAPLVLYMTMSNPLLTRITHSQETRSQFQGRANNSPPCHRLDKIFPRRLLSNVTCVCLYVHPNSLRTAPPTDPPPHASHCMFVCWNKRMDAQLRQPLFVTVQPCRHPIKWPVANLPSHTASNTSLLPTEHQS